MQVFVFQDFHAVFLKKEKTSELTSHTTKKEFLIP